MRFLQVFIGLLPLIAAKLYIADLKLDSGLIHRISKLLGTRQLSTSGGVSHHKLKNMNLLALDVLSNLTKKYSFCKNCRMDAWPKKGIDKLFKFKIVQFRIDYEDIINADVILTNLAVKGVQELQVKNYDIDQQKLNMDFDLFFPELLITAKYEIDGTVDGGKKILQPDGKFIFTLQKLNLKGNVLAGKGGKYYFLEDLKVTPDIEKSSISLTGLMENGKINNLFGLILDKLSDGFIRSRVDTLKRALYEKARDVLNKVLTRIEIAN